VIRLLAALGAGFDCASTSEIDRILALKGVPPSRIIFANPCKPISFIRNAAAVNVDLMTFDNTDELHKIVRLYPSARLVIRILTDDSESLVKLGMKFGAHLDVVPDLLATAKNLDVNVVGVSFHVGSGCFNPNVYRNAIKRASAVFEMGRRAGYHFSLLDVGGGFEDRSFEHAASVLTDAIADYFPDRQSIDIIAEPGRFFVATAFRLATNVIARRAPTSESTIEEAKKGSDDDPPTVMCTSLAV
jgi:ornithine decarboxylase